MSKALICNKFGNPSELELQEINNSEPETNHLGIEVIACGLNFFDTLIINGKYQLKPKMPFSPGAEIAGRIVKTGENVSKFKIGDRVMAYCSYGGCREYLNIHQDKLILMNDKTDFATAAGIIITYGTMFYALVERAKIKNGQTILILGASGGVGTASIEIARAKGATVIAAASTEQKCQICQDVGAHYTINYQKHDIKQWIKQKFSKIDIIVDPIGGDQALQALRCLRSLGKFIVIGFAAGNITLMPLNLALLKNIDIIGINWAFFVQDQKHQYQNSISLIQKWILEKKIKPKINKIYGIRNAISSLEDIKNRNAKGKFVVIMNKKTQ